MLGLELHVQSQNELYKRIQQHGGNNGETEVLFKELLFCKFETINSLFRSTINNVSPNSMIFEKANINDLKKEYYTCYLVNYQKAATLSGLHE